MYSNPPEKLLITLLFPGTEVSRIPWGDFSDKDFAFLLRFPKLLPLICHRLLPLPEEKEVSPAVSQFIAQVRSGLFRAAAGSMRNESQERRIVESLVAHGIPALVFKGNTLAEDLYGESCPRPSVDIDILIKQQDVARADKILGEAGYKRVGDLPFSFLFYRIHHATYVYPGQGVPVDVHWTFGVPFFFRLQSDDIWAEVVHERTDNIYSLSPEMLLVMLLVHHHLHFFREFRILVDILWALDKYGTDIQWDAFAKRLQDIGLLKSSYLVLNQLHGVWGERCRDISAIGELKRELDLLHVQVPHWLCSYFRMELEDRRRNVLLEKLFSRLLLDGLLMICTSYLKTLLPPERAIRALYRDERKWMLPMNYLRFIFWRLRDWSDRLTG